MFSYADLVRDEIALAVDEQYGVSISEKEAEGWQTLGDVARSVVSHSNARVAESEVFEWVRALIVEGYGDTEAAKLTPESLAFSDYDRATTWFTSAPYPHRLCDRWFTRNPSLAQSRLAPYYCAYNAPSDLTALPPSWRTDEVIALARRMFTSRDFSALPTLADALQAAGCNDSTVLYHCRNPNATHFRGCWVVDLILCEGRYRVEPADETDYCGSG